MFKYESQNPKLKTGNSEKENQIPQTKKNIKIYDI